MTATFLLQPRSASVSTLSARKLTEATANTASVKPMLRGRLHQLCALASLPAGTHLVAHSSPGHRLPAFVYAITWTAMFATSACYHRLAHSPTAQRRLRRADHSMIFVHIGATSTSLGLLSLSPLVACVLLTVVWSGVAGGIGLKLTRLVDGGSAGSKMYGVLGGTQAFAMPLIAQSVSLAQVALLAISCAVYGVGALLFFRQRLDLFPRVFGYHEVWHCFTLIGGLCQYLLIASLTS